MIDMAARSAANQANSSLAQITSQVTANANAITGISASPKGVYTYLSGLQSAYPTGNSNTYIVTGNVQEVDTLNITVQPTASGNVTVTLNGVATNVPVTIGTAEVDTLNITAGATTAGNISITLNSVATTVAVTAGDTAGAIGDKIRATSFTGWTVGGTAGSSSVKFTKNIVGINTTPTFADISTTGTTASFTVTTAGANADTTTSVATKIRGISFSGWTTGGTGTSITFTKNIVGTNTTPSYSAGTTGTIGTITVTTAGANIDGNWYFWNGSVWIPGGIYQGTLSPAIQNIINEVSNFYSVTVGKNLFNINTFKRDTEIDTSTHLEKYNGSNYGVSDYIPVMQNKTIYFSMNNIAWTAFYIYTFDLNQNFIARKSSSFTTYAVEPGVAFIRLLIYQNTLINTFQAEYDAVTSFATYTETSALTADNITQMNNDISTLQDDITTLQGGSPTSNVLYGKNYVPCGDSLTAGAYANLDSQGIPMTYAYYIAKRNGMSLNPNAVSGSTMTTFKDGVSGGGGAFTYGDQWARYKTLGNNIDYITIWFGINDNTYLANTNGIGTIDSTDKTTYYGAWNTVMQYLIATYPKAKIGIIVTYGASQDIRDATRAIALKYGIKPLDFMGDNNIPIVSGYGRDNGTVVDPTTLTVRRNTFINSSDSVHPIDAGYQYLSTIVENYLRSL